MNLESLIAAALPTVLVTVGGIVSWIIKSRTEEYRASKERLQEARTRNYWEVLEPYIVLFSGTTTEETKANILAKLTSSEYKKTTFELNLMGSDGVVGAHNSLMQHVFESERTGQQDPKRIITLWGNLLLEIRKNIGERKTKLKEKDMLRSMIKDIDEVLD